MNKLQNQLKKEEESIGAFTELIKIVGCTSNDTSASSITHHGLVKIVDVWNEEACFVWTICI